MNRRLFNTLFAVAGATSACSDPFNRSNKKRAESMPRVKKLNEMPSRYTATPADWKVFLESWAKEAGGKVELPATSTHEGYPVPKYERETLPNSYVHFVAATGGQGWQMPGDVAFGPGAATPGLYPIDGLGSYKQRIRESWKAFNDNPSGRKHSDAEIYHYSIGQDSYAFRHEQIHELVIVGEWFSGSGIALNPTERTSDGEWEAWFIAPRWGAYRYRCFAELMVNVHFADRFPERDLSQVKGEELLALSSFGVYRHFLDLR